MSTLALERSAGSAAAEVTARLLDAASAGHVPTLAVLRAEFERAGLTPSQGRLVLAELAATGVTLSATAEKPARSASGRKPARSTDHPAADKPAADKPARPKQDREAAASPSPAAKPVAPASATPPAAAGTPPAAAGTPPAAAGDTPAAPATGPAVVAAAAVAAAAPARDDETPEPAAGEVSADTDLVKVYLREIGRVPLLDSATEVELAQRIEVGLYAAHLLARVEEEGESALASVAGAPRLDELHRLVADGAAAKERMLEANLRLAVSVAKKYQRRGVDFLDVVQESNLGLIRAVEKFDWKAGFKFSTYAMWWLRQSTQRGLAEQARTIRLPQHVVDELARLGKARRELAVALGEEPSEEQLATAMGLPETKVADLMRTARDVLSLDAPLGDGTDGGVLGDLVADRAAPDAFDEVSARLVREQLIEALDVLAPRERVIMRLRFGLQDGREHTLAEVGEHLGLTRERVRQLEKECLRRLRDEQQLAELLADVAA